MIRNIFRIAGIVVIYLLFSSYGMGMMLACLFVWWLFVTTFRLR